MNNRKLWEKRMSNTDFALLKRILEAPSPSNMEGAMTFGVIEPIFQTLIKNFKKSWQIHKFKGNASLVLDTKPNRFHKDVLNIMIISHADKIRLQVKSIGNDGKIWLSSRSFLPVSLISNKVKLYSKDPKDRNNYRVFYGTVEALGAIHFADSAIRSGEKGINPNHLYLELGVYGEYKHEQIKKLGIKPGDSILLDREVERGFFPNIFSGPYLDNGLGCFVVTQLSEMFAKQDTLNSVRLLFAFASQEEIGRYGSQVIAGKLNIDILISVDVSHDYTNAPNIAGEHFPEIEIGSGFTIPHGSVVSRTLNNLIIEIAEKHIIPYQLDFKSVDTGTDAMAGVRSSKDIAVTSLGLPIRNMHTASELGHTGDVLACIHSIYNTILEIDQKGMTRKDLITSHPQLQKAEKAVYK